MPDSRMMAEVAAPGCWAMVNVSGRRIATPLAPPRPGSTPMMTPRTMPASISIRLNHDSATAKPPRREWISCIAAPLCEAEGGFQRTLGQRHAEPDLEHDEGRDHGAHAHQYDLRPPVLAEEAHEEGDEGNRGNVHAEAVSGAGDDSHVDER